MSDGIAAELIKVIASHQNIRKASEPDRRLLSGIAPHILIWLCTNKLRDWRLKDEDMENIKYLYEIGNYNGNSRVDDTLLHLAVSANAIDMVRLVKQITDEKEKKAKEAKEEKIADANYTRKTVLHRAAGAGDIDKVKKLLDDSEVDCNYGDESKMTPIHHAAKNGHSDVVKLLLADDEVDCNYGDKSGMTSIHHAVKNGHSEVVKLLLADDKVKIDIEDCQGNTPLMLAVIVWSSQSSSDKQKPYDDMFNMMLGNPKASIYAFNHQLHTPLSWAFKTQPDVGYMFLHTKLFIEIPNTGRRDWQR